MKTVSLWKFSALGFPSAPSPGSSISLAGPSVSFAGSSKFICYISLLLHFAQALWVALLFMKHANAFLFLPWIFLPKTLSWLDSLFLLEFLQCPLLSKIFLHYLILFCHASNMWDLSSLTRDQSCVLCIGSTESQPLDHQEVLISYFKFQISLWDFFWLIFFSIML